MANRGRVSAAEREAPNPVGGSVAVLAQRPDPPAWLGDEEAAEWVAIVNRLAADRGWRTSLGGWSGLA